MDKSEESRRTKMVLPFLFKCLTQTPVESLSYILIHRSNLLFKKHHKIL